MLGWVLLVSGILVAGYAAIVGFIAWEVTLVLIVFGLVDAVTGAVLVVRNRRAT